MPSVLFKKKTDAIHQVKKMNFNNNIKFNKKRKRIKRKLLFIIVLAIDTQHTHTHKNDLILFLRHTVCCYLVVIKITLN